MRVPILVGHAPTQAKKADTAGSRPLHAAAAAGDADALGAVLAALSLAAHAAADEGPAPSIAAALDERDALGATALHLAAAGEFFRGALGCALFFSMPVPAWPGGELGNAGGGGGRSSSGGAHNLQAPPSSRPVPPAPVLGLDGGLDPVTAAAYTAALRADPYYGALAGSVTPAVLATLAAVQPGLLQALPAEVAVAAAEVASGASRAARPPPPPLPPPLEERAAPAPGTSAAAAAAAIARASSVTAVDPAKSVIFVNPRQYARIMKRREARARAEAAGLLVKARGAYMHETRHQAALRRAREGGGGGRFVAAGGVGGDRGGGGGAGGQGV
jgi:hypothetical protein